MILEITAVLSLLPFACRCGAQCVFGPPDSLQPRRKLRFRQPLDGALQQTTFDADHTLRVPQSAEIGHLTPGSAMRFLTQSPTTMKAQMNQPRRHHFVPRFYLEGFCAEDARGLAVYDRVRNAYRAQRPAEVAHRRDYYAYEDEQGNRFFDIEAALGEVETAASRSIRRVDNRDELTDDDRMVLAMYVAFQYTRTPAYAAWLGAFRAHWAGGGMSWRRYQNRRTRQLGGWRPSARCCGMRRGLPMFFFNSTGQSGVASRSAFPS
ncbi:DUF4238 domain-containing protein [Burkholderia ubonensis]|uniref:DUF4238 domain-containing protein n=1 Tax=Burkholderia ubonensis TaxID=101571 RepID=UPI0009B450B6